MTNEEGQGYTLAAGGKTGLDDLLPDVGHSQPKRLPKLRKDGKADGRSLSPVKTSRTLEQAAADLRRQQEALVGIGAAVDTAEERLSLSASVASELSQSQSQSQSQDSPSSATSLLAESGSIIEQDGLDSSAPPRLFNASSPRRFLKGEKYEHRLIAYLKASGLSDTEISAKTGYSLPHLNVIKKQPFFEALVLSEMQSIGKGPLKRLADACDDAAGMLIDIMQNAENDEIRRKACNDILDRRFGKPNQPMSMVSKPVSEMSDAELAEYCNKN